MTKRPETVITTVKKYLLSLILSCLCVYGTAEAGEAKSTAIAPTTSAVEFKATLPNGATVELLALSTNDERDDAPPPQWWRPDGTLLSEGLYHYAGSGMSSIYARRFAICIEAEGDYSCMTFNSLGQTDVQPKVPFDAQNKKLPHLRAFLGKADKRLSSDTIRVGVATGPWQTVEEWHDNAWHKHDPDNIIVSESENPLVFFWPRTKRGAVILETVSSYMDQALRMKITKKGGHSYYETPRTFGQGKGLVRHQYWLWDIALEELGTAALEKRPYQWVEFQNVSLEPDRLTDVKTLVLPVKSDAFSPFTAQADTCLGALLDGLHRNVRLPLRGHANYEVCYGGQTLTCDYLFDGSRYRFHVKDKGTRDTVTLFDGYRSVMWHPGYDYATINRLERMDSIVYKLDQYCPKKYIDQLYTHNVKPLADEVIDGTPCKVLENVVSAKETVKLWVATEPDVFPLRIERYENGCLRFRYQAEHLQLWNNQIFPKTFSIAYYKADSHGQPSFISEKRIALHAFAPWIQLTPEMLGKDLPESVLAQLPELRSSAYSLVGKPIAVTRIPGMSEHLKAGQPALVCFCDINQRPSRNCLTQLKQRASRLEQEGLKPIAVQSSIVDSQQLEDWIRENSIPFPVLMAHSGFEQRRSNWGIHSLPQIVLTDADHFVTEEGVAVEKVSK